MMKTLRSILLLAAVLVTATPAYAQLVNPQPRQGRPVRGLFGGGTGNYDQQLVLNISMGAGYDKDKAGQADGGPGQPPIIYPSRTGNYANGSMGLNYSLSRDKISAGADISTNGRLQPNQPTDLLRAFGTGAHVTAQLATRTSLSASAGLSVQPHNQDLLYGSWVNPGAPVDATMDLSGSTTDTNHANSRSAVNFTQGITQRIGVTAQYSYHRQGLWFSEDADSSTQSASVGVSVAIFRGARFRVAYGSSTSTYGAGPTGIKTKYSGLMLDGGIDVGRAISLSRRATFTFSTGVAGARDEGGALHYVATGHGALSYELGRSWTADVNYQRGVDFNQGLAQPVVLDTMSGGVSGDLGRRVQLSANAGFAHGKIGVGETFDRSYNAWSGRLNVRTALTRLLGVSVQYAYRHYEFDNTVSLPIGVRPSTDRQTVRASLDLWLPLITRTRSANASR